ncbi:hypothetical protein ACWKWO_00375 [Schumannella luteola]
MILSAAVSVVLLAGCSAPAPEPAEPLEPSTAPSAPPVEATEPPSDSEPGASAVAPTGCDLVTADLVSSILGVDPGVCEPITSWADGPAGLYPSITMAIDTTASAPTIMPVEVCGGGGIDGALPVPGADYGYAVEGDLCVVVGTLGVKTSALLDYGVAPAEKWQQLAIALVERLS